MQFNSPKPRTAYINAIQDQPSTWQYTERVIPDINIAAFAAGYNKLMLRALHKEKKQTDLK